MLLWVKAGQVRSSSPPKACTAQIAVTPQNTKTAQRSQQKTDPRAVFSYCTKIIFASHFRRATTPPRTAYAVGSPPPAVCRQRTAVPVIQPRSCNRYRIAPCRYILVITAVSPYASVCSGRTGFSEGIAFSSCSYPMQTHRGMLRQYRTIFVRYCLTPPVLPDNTPAAASFCPCRKMPLLRHGCGHPFAGGAAYSLPAVQWHLHSL